MNRKQRLLSIVTLFTFALVFTATSAMAGDDAYRQTSLNNGCGAPTQPLKRGSRNAPATVAVTMRATAEKTPSHTDASIVLTRADMETLVAAMQNAMRNDGDIIVAVVPAETAENAALALVMATEQRSKK